MNKAIFFISTYFETLYLNIILKIMLCNIIKLKYILFRKALVGEDVEFTQPLRREEAEKDAGDQVEEEEEKECCDSETKVLKGGADDILESLGIEADSLPG